MVISHSFSHFFVYRMALAMKPNDLIACNLRGDVTCKEVKGYIQFGVVFLRGWVMGGIGYTHMRP